MRSVGEKDMLAGQIVLIYIRHEFLLADSDVRALHNGREARAPRKRAVT